MEFKDYYSTLGISRDADEKELRAAYRKLAREYHPDVNREDPNAEERFKEISEAYEVLKDPDKRAKYDRFGADWERYQQAETSGAQAEDFSEWFSGGAAGGPQYRYEYRSTGGSGFSDFFDTLFGDAFGRTTTRQGPQPQRGQDFEYPVEISLADAYHGTTRRFDISMQERCTNCGGTGLNGVGVCPICRGSGTVPRTKTLEVKIPAGVRTGSRVRVAGQASPGTNGGPPGDIYLRVRIQSDPRFEIDGNNLRTVVEVPLYTSLLGGEAIVETLDGRLALTIPEGTQNGKVFRLRDKGLPASGSGTRGDLLARVKVVLPENLTDDEKNLFRKLQNLRSDGS